MTKYHGSRRSPYFEGWYLKHQNGRETVALIPAVHIGQNGVPSASLQIITDETSHCIHYPLGCYEAEPGSSVIRLGNSVFSKKGCRLDYSDEEISVKGLLRYGPFSAPEYDIMGPFRYVPLMQCRHSVFSFRHSVDGRLRINNKTYCFHRGTGYMEGDRGCSFPKHYLWTQSSIKEGCIFLSIADIPFCGSRFDGCIGSIYYKGKEFRFATYLGARLIHFDQSSAVVAQGKYSLSVRLVKPASAQPLQAPDSGQMDRTIHEHASCTVEYTFCENGRTKLHVFSDCAGFESA